MNERPFPQDVRSLSTEETFCFHCHPEVSCFNECCRLLDLALTPYDTLRLKEALGLSSYQFLEQYALVEFSDIGDFPEIYLGMVDDGRGRCPFVVENGCSVYSDRPGACRTYPLGRGIFRTQAGETKHINILLTEPHCCGFQGNKEQSIDQWMLAQGLTPYNALNEKLLGLLHHDSIKHGEKLNKAQQKLFIDTLYDLDSFRQVIKQSDDAQKFIPEVQDLEKLIKDQVSLLECGIHWLRHKFFND